jgi:DNA modification methylase
MMMTTTPKPHTLLEYLKNDQLLPLFLTGNALEILQTVPNECIDCCITSPPYWSKRQYDNGGIGMENTFPEYLENLRMIIAEVNRVLTKTGYFWLNLGDIVIFIHFCTPQPPVHGYALPTTVDPTGQAE